MLPKRRIFILVIFILFLAIFYFNCKDLGSAPPPAGLTAATTDVFVIKGSNTGITLSGGKTPYAIKTQPSVSIASIALSSAVVTITGVDTGQTYAVVNDSKSPEQDTVRITITVVLTLPPANVSFSNQVQPLFNTYCTNCHGSQGGLSLNAGASRSNLVNIAAQSSCISMPRVLPNDALHSVLYLKVSGTTCSTRMPQGGVLSQSDIDIIRNWINQGANDN